MALTFALVGDRIEFTTRGDVDFEEGLSVLRAAFDAARAAAREGGPPRWHAPFDVRESTESRSSDELRGIASAIAQQRDILSGRCAVLVRGDLYYGLARMVSAWLDLDDVDMRVFREPEEAVTWLDRELAS